MLPKLKFVVVEDHPLLADTYRSIYGMYLGAEVLIASSDEEADNIFENIIEHKLDLDLITTDINHPSSGGVHLIRKIRSYSDDQIVAGGKRIRQLPIVVISADSNPSSIITAFEIDPSIKWLFKGKIDPEKVIKEINHSLSEYRNKILSSFHRVGLAIVCEGGFYKILDAYSLPPNKIENKYIASLSDSNEAGKTYSRLMLVNNKWRLTAVAINVFESLLNNRNTNERDFQKFFEIHPEFILRDEYDSYWAEPVIKSPATGKQIRPDFVLQPSSMRRNTWNWSLVDLKRPNVPIITHERFHADLSNHVYRVATQLRDYQQFFEDPRNHEVISRRFGGIVPKPKLVAVIGRLPIDHIDKYATLRSRLNGICITTYDEILEFHKTKLDRMKSILE